MTVAVERASRAFASARRALIAGARGGARAAAERAPSLGAFHRVVGHHAMAWRLARGIGPARGAAAWGAPHRGFAAGADAGSGNDGEDAEDAEEGDSSSTKSSDLLSLSQDSIDDSLLDETLDIE